MPGLYLLRVLLGGGLPFYLIKVKYIYRSLPFLKARKILYMENLIFCFLSRSEEKFECRRGTVTDAPTCWWVYKPENRAGICLRSL